MTLQPRTDPTTAGCTGPQGGAAPSAEAVALPDNVTNVVRTERVWNRVRLVVTDFQCAGPVVHRLGSQDETCLSTVLEEVGGRCEPRLRKNRPSPAGYVPRHMTLVPAGTEVWGHADTLRFARDASLYFDPAPLEERLGIRLDADALHAPRLCFADDPSWTLVRLLADVVHDPDPSAQLYGDGLVAAICAKVFSHRHNNGGRAGAGLAPWQLRRVIERMEDRLPDRVELAELATLTRLSQSHFSKAFKASTGLAPYHWQLDARIRRAQALLMDSHASLEQVAEAAGFADAVHFGRTFRKFVGTSPAAWRHDRKH